jgi:hypothetical protein
MRRFVHDLARIARRARGTDVPAVVVQRREDVVSPVCAREFQRVSSSRHTACYNLHMSRLTPEELADARLRSGGDVTDRPVSEPLISSPTEPGADAAGCHGFGTQSSDPKPLAAMNEGRLNRTPMSRIVRFREALTAFPEHGLRVKR